MNQHFFAVRDTPLKGGKMAATKRNRIAREIDSTAGYVYFRDKSSGAWKGWGYCRNRGNPFDERTAREIQEAWTSAGV